FLAGVVFAPGQVVFQNDRGADRVQDGLAPFAKGAALAQKAGGGDGGLPLVPHADGQAAFLPPQLGQPAALFGTPARGALPVPGPAPRAQPGPLVAGGFGAAGWPLGPGLLPTLWLEGGGPQCAGVAEGEAGAAVAVRHC